MRNRQYIILIKTCLGMVNEEKFYRVISHTYRFWANSASAYSNTQPPPPENEEPQYDSAWIPLRHPGQTNKQKSHLSRTQSNGLTGKKRHLWRRAPICRHNRTKITETPVMSHINKHLSFDLQFFFSIHHAHSLSVTLSATGKTYCHTCYRWNNYSFSSYSNHYVFITSNKV